MVKFSAILNIVSFFCEAQHIDDEPATSLMVNCYFLHICTLFHLPSDFTTRCYKYNSSNNSTCVCRICNNIQSSEESAIKLKKQPKHLLRVGQR